MTLHGSSPGPAPAGGTPGEATPVPAQRAPVPPGQPAVPALQRSAPQPGAATAPPPAAGAPAAVPATAAPGLAAGTTAGATAATASIASAQQAATATAVPASPTLAPSPGAQHTGTLYGGRQHANGRRRGRGPLVRLRIGSHTATLAALSAMAVTPVPNGLLLGVDRDRQPVPIRFFRADPTRIALVGAEWAGEVLAFRALALGARVVVVTHAPAPWHSFGERAVGRGAPMAVVPPHQPVQQPASPTRPVLIIHDLAGAPAVPLPPTPWQTQLTVVRDLNPETAAPVREANLVMLQRLRPAEAQAATTVLGVTPQTAALLQVLEPDMVALLGGGADRYVWLSPTTVERSHAGPPRR
jgi:hypothetical protein